MGHRRHVVGIRVQRCRGRADVDPQAGNREQSQAHGSHKQCEPGFDPAFRHACLTLYFKVICVNDGEMLDDDRRLGRFALLDDRLEPQRALPAATACRLSTRDRRRGQIDILDETRIDEAVAVVRPPTAEMRPMP